MCLPGFGGMCLLGKSQKFVDKLHDLIWLMERLARVDVE